MNALPLGVDVKTVGSSNQIAFDSFVTNHLKTIGAALNLPFEVLMKNFQSSYSASRAALLQAQSEFNNRKAAFIADFCQPIYELWLREAVSLGRIDAPMYERDDYAAKLYTWCEWVGPSQGQLNPVQEVQASVMKIENNLSTYQRECAEMTGEDWDLVMSALKRERENAGNV